MTVIVTGGTGFIGSALTSKLSEEGFEVVSISRNKPQDAHPGVKYESGLHLERLIELFSNADVIFHLASYFTNSIEPAELAKLHESNVNFTSLVGMASSVTDLKFIINVESMSQHVEGRIGNASNIYARSKQMGSNILESWCKNHATLLHLALFDTYGPHDARPKLVPRLLSQTSTSPTMKLSRGDQLVDFLHINDVIDGLIFAWEQLKKGKFESSETHRYRLSSYMPISLREFVENLETGLSRNFNTQWGALDYRAGEMFYDWTLPEKLPGWKPTFSLEMGIETLRSKQ